MLRASFYLTSVRKSVTSSSDKGHIDQKLLFDLTENKSVLDRNSEFDGALGMERLGREVLFSRAWK